MAKKAMTVVARTSKYLISRVTVEFSIRKHHSVCYENNVIVHFPHFFQIVNLQFFKTALIWSA